MGHLRHLSFTFILCSIFLTYTSRSFATSRKSNSTIFFSPCVILFPSNPLRNLPGRYIIRLLTNLVSALPSLRTRSPGKIVIFVPAKMPDKDAGTPRVFLYRHGKLQIVQIELHSPINGRQGRPNGPRTAAILVSQS